MAITNSNASIPSSMFGPAKSGGQPQQSPLTVPPNSLGGQSQAAMDALSQQANTGQILPGQQQQFMANAPQVQLPDFSQLPQIQSFVPQVRESGRLKLESGLAALRSQYGQQEEDLSSQLAAAGTYDSGDKNKLQKRMFEQRGSQESQLIYNIQAESLAQEVAEMQRVGTISEERARMMMDQQFEKAITEGNWAQAAAIHNSDMAMQVKDYNQRSLELTANLKQMGYDNSIKWIDSQINQSKLEIEQRGLNIEEHKVEVAAYETQLKGCVYGHGEGTDGAAACIQDAKLEFEAAIGSEGGGGGGGGAGGFTPASTPGTYSGATDPYSIEKYSKIGDLLKGSSSVAGAARDMSPEGSQKKIGNTVWLKGPRGYTRIS